MKKKYIAIGLILILLGCILLLEINKSNEIDFDKITNFEWDTMYVFTPYSNPKDILEKDNISTYNSSFIIENSDTINMIGFVKSNKLVGFVELPQIYGGVDLTNVIKFSKEETKFSILQDKKTILFKKN